MCSTTDCGCEDVAATGGVGIADWAAEIHGFGAGESLHGERIKLNRFEMSCCFGGECQGWRRSRG